MKCLNSYKLKFVLSCSIFLIVTQPRRGDMLVEVTIILQNNIGAP